MEGRTVEMIKWIRKNLSTFAMRSVSFESCTIFLCFTVPQGVVVTHAVEWPVSVKTGSIFVTIVDTSFTLVDVWKEYGFKFIKPFTCGIPEVHGQTDTKYLDD